MLTAYTQYDPVRRVVLTSGMLPNAAMSQLIKVARLSFPVVPIFGRVSESSSDYPRYYDIELRDRWIQTLRCNSLDMYEVTPRLAMEEEILWHFLSKNVLEVEKALLRRFGTNGSDAMSAKRWWSFAVAVMAADHGDPGGPLVARVEAA